MFQLLCFFSECDELKEELSEGKEQVGQLLNQVTLLQKEVSTVVIGILVWCNKYLRFFIMGYL